MRRPPPGNESGRHLAANMAAWVLSLSATLVASAQDPPGPEADRPAAPLARYFPREHLVAYAEFAGLDAHADAWRRTAAYRLLNETSAGAMLEALAVQVVGQSAGPDRSQGPTGAEWVGLAKHALRRGFALGLVRPPGASGPSCVGMVLRGAAAGPARAALGRLLDAGSGRSEAVTKPGGRTVIVAGGPRGRGFAWWTEGEDLAVCFETPDGADVMIEALDGRRPDAADHPTRADLVAADEGFTPVGLAFVELAALPTLPPRAAALGLDRVRRLEYRWGFRDEALVTVTRLVAPAPRTGLLALFDQPTFAAADLPPLPAGLTGFAVASLDPDRVYDLLAELAPPAGPPGRGTPFQALDRAVRDATGRKLREDILAHLGPRVATYVVPTTGHLPADPISGWLGGLARVPRAVILIEVENPAAFGKVLDDLVERANQAFRARGEAPQAEFRPSKGDRRGYVLSVPPSVAPLPAGMRPTVMLGRRFLAVATTPGVAEEALDLEDRPGGPALPDDHAEAAGTLPDDMLFLAVDDPRASLLPELIANLPSLVQLAAIRSTRRFAAIGRMPRREFGIPSQPARGPGFRVAIDPDLIPDPDDLRPFLFPATSTLTVDEEGVRFTTREAFPGLSPTTLAPLGMAVLLPAVQSAREASRRAQSTNNLKQIGLALHNYHDTFGHLPPPDLLGKDGKPLLSWRVALLPYLEQAPLYNAFRLDEPWDSPHNQALAERMPPVYAVPGSRAEPGRTFYRAFAGAGTIFDPGIAGGVGFPHIVDGLSNTIAVVEAREAVPWTKPGSDLPFDTEARPVAAGDLLPRLGGHFTGGFNALIADGAVRFIKESINSNVLRALITRDGGEVISSDSY